MSPEFFMILPALLLLALLGLIRFAQTQRIRRTLLGIEHATREQKK